MMAMFLMLIFPKSPSQLFTVAETAQFAVGDIDLSGQKKSEEGKDEAHTCAAESFSYYADAPLGTPNADKTIAL